MTPWRLQAAAEREALAMFNERLLARGCRSWLRAGLSSRSARLEGALQAQAQRGTRSLQLAERCARHWRNKALLRQRERAAEAPSARLLPPVLLSPRPPPAFPATRTRPPPPPQLRRQALHLSPRACAARCG